MENTYSEFWQNAKENSNSEYARELLEKIEENARSDSVWESARQMFESGFGGVFSLPEWTRSAFIILSVLLILYVFESSFKSKGIYTAVCYIVRLLLASAVVLPISNALNVAFGYMQEVASFFGVITPTLGIVTAAGGNAATATAGNVFLSVFLSLMQILLYKICPAVCAVFFGFALLDAVGTDSKMLMLSKTVRNICFGTFSILTALFFIVVNTQTLAASSTDTLSAKTLRLIVGNTVPIVGGTLSDALKLVGGSLISVKNALGVGAIVFLLLMYLPLLFVLWGNGILMNIFSFLCDYFSLTQAKGVFLHMKYILDFVFAAFTSLFVIGIVNIGMFMKVMPALFSG